MKKKPISRFNKAPVRLLGTWEWFCATCAFDFGDSKPLSELIRSSPVPDEYRAMVADVVDGIRRPNKKAAVKLRIAARDMMNVAAKVSSSIDLIHMIKSDVIPVKNGPYGVEGIADRDGKEPIEVKREYERLARVLFSDAALHHKVSIETVENLVREMRARISRWPLV